MNRTDLAYQVSLTLGDHIDDFDIDAIVEDLIENHDGPLNSIDDIEDTAYWAAVEKHDTTQAHDADATNDDGSEDIAWLGVQAGILVHDNGPEVMILNHEKDGYTSEVMPSTSLPLSLDADHDAMVKAAETALQAAGWETVGDWDDVDTGYTVKVRRA
ncbi:MULTISPECIES: hypothetical protein [Streptomyces]|uniref:Uncharacterized protein n=1 Tax=Streptomyces fradiae ATCC 10745 = DSM 40063 TaxID=1319510 RepID=A0A1Y2NNM9_STRFR|nr:MULTISPECIES: hypothetical protein [Streptomyces]KAF0646290.1 hypothetical protein K701_29435 [Streptomyces fradiae ATCC 10745 = DSM 40063]OSY49076.1 hypothetical protein BG846_05315 [Streptomyces fradiae ATCC 10745 = DSM 40063]